MSKKKALITGITGQDGAYLAKFLIKKNYIVVGGERENRNNNRWRLEALNIKNKVKFVSFELMNENIINNEIKTGKYDEIYNLAAQSYVDKSFNNPIYTSDVNSLGVMRLLEAIREFSSNTKLYQASSSEMFGNVNSIQHNEETNFNPVSPYAVSKLYAHKMVEVYRNAYNLFCCSGILFNHTSPLRGNEFVTKKIIIDLIKIKLKIIPCLFLGNIHVKRDWGYSADYVEAMWKILQHKEPEDFVISTGVAHTVKDFINKVAIYLELDIKWKGKGLNEVAICNHTNEEIIKINKEFFRPNDIDTTFGNSFKAKKLLKWKPKTDFESLIKIMCDAEIKKFNDF